jgi:hypothetical protein
MAGITNYLATKLNDHQRGVASYTMPTVWVGLTTTTSSASTPGTETTYTNYARVAAAGLLGASTAGAGVNSSTIPFATCGVTGATIAGWATYDASSGGNQLEFGTCSLVVSSGITPQFANGALSQSIG